MLLLTTDTIPDSVEVEQVFGLVEVTEAIEISQKNFLRRMTEKDNNGHQNAIESLAATAKRVGGNIVYGIKHSTAIGQFNNGTYLYITYIGTAAKGKYD